MRTPRLGFSCPPARIENVAGTRALTEPPPEAPPPPEGEAPPVGRVVPEAVEPVDAVDLVDVAVDA